MMAPPNHPLQRHWGLKERRWSVRGLICVGLALILFGCGPKGAQNSTGASVKQNSNILKVAVMHDGRIFADGQHTTLSSLRDTLMELSKNNGSVWYYREEGQAEPPPEATQVIQAIIDNRLPVKLSSKPDFSDSLGPDDQSTRQ
jgi:hypothetical protein